MCLSVCVSELCRRTLHASILCSRSASQNVVSSSIVSFFYAKQSAGCQVSAHKREATLYDYCRRLHSEDSLIYPYLLWRKCSEWARPPVLLVLQEYSMYASRPNLRDSNREFEQIGERQLLLEFGRVNWKPFEALLHWRLQQKFFYYRISKSQCFHLKNRIQEHRFKRESSTSNRVRV